MFLSPATRAAHSDGPGHAAPRLSLVPSGPDAPADDGRIDDASADGGPLRRQMGLITLAWVFGGVWMAAVNGSPATQFLRGLGATNFQFGLMAALPFLASLLSVPASLLIERTGRRKTLFLVVLYVQRLMWFPIALVPVWIAGRGGPEAGGWAVAAFLVLVFLMHASGAVGGPAWVSWMADVVPPRLRSRYFARRRQWGIPLAIASALLVGFILDRQAAPGHDGAAVLRWCAIIFMAAAVFGTVDIAMFHFVPETPNPPKRGGGLLRAMATPLRDARFLWFAGFVATLTFAVSFMNQFVTLYLQERVYVGPRAASFGSGAQWMLVVMPMLAQLVVLGACGLAAERMGKKPLLVLAGLGMVPVAVGWCAVGPSNVWLGYVLSAAGAALWTGVEVANFNMVIEMSAGDGDEGGGGKGGSAYVAVNTVVVNVAGCLGGLAAGLIAQALATWNWTPAWGFKTFTFYDTLFVLSGVLRLAAVVVFLPFIHEPTARRTRETLRFVAAAVSAGFARAAVEPLRLAARARTAQRRRGPIAPAAPARPAPARRAA